MHLIRFLSDGSDVPHYGMRVNGAYALRIQGDILGDWQVTDERRPIRKLLAPIQPAVILAIGLNFRSHAQETGQPIPQHPVLFMKSPWVAQNPDDPIVIPTHLPSTQVDYEAELVVVLGKTCKNATLENALDFVLGYTCGNDVTARDWQKSFGGSQWCRAKSFDTFAPLGPDIVTPDEIPDPQNLNLKAYVNGELRQSGTTADHIFSVRDLIVFLSGSTTLPAGTVIFTGTPTGAGFARHPPLFLKHGDVVTIAIEHLGSLTNPVIDE